MVLSDILKSSSCKFPSVYHCQSNPFLYICQNLTNMLFVDKIRAAREAQSIPQKQVAKVLNIDVPMYSRIERGERPAKKEQVIAIAHYLGIDEKELLNLWLAEKVFKLVNNTEDAGAILDIVSENIE